MRSISTMAAEPTRRPPPGPRRPLRALIPLLPALLVLGSAPCGCKGKNAADKVTRVSPKRTQVLKTRAQRPGNIKKITARVPIKDQMELAMKGLSEISRRAGRNFPIDMPAQMIFRSLDQIPVLKFPATFGTYLEDVQDRLVALKKKDREYSIEEVNGLVESCLACHRVYHQQMLPAIMSKRIKKTEAQGKPASPTAQPAGPRPPAAR